MKRWRSPRRGSPLADVLVISGISPETGDPGSPALMRGWRERREDRRTSRDGTTMPFGWSGTTWEERIAVRMPLAEVNRKVTS